MHVDDPLRRTAVDLADDLARDAPPLRRELVGCASARSIPLRHLVEVVGTVERGGLHQLPVVLAEDVLRRPALAGRRALVVEDADRRPVVDEASSRIVPAFETTQLPCWRSVARTSRSV